MGQFAFMLHPLDLSYVIHQYPVTRYIPEGILKWVLKHAPPLKLSHITGIESELGSAEGHFIACLLTSRQILELPEELVMQKIIDAGRLAEKQGAKIIGLGAFTAVVGGAGEQLADRLDIAVTTGNSYTVATALEGTRQAVDFMDYDLLETDMAIVGATGSIGQVCAEIMAREVQELTLIARNETRLKALRDRILTSTGLSARISTDVESGVRRSDVVIAVSSAAEAIIHPDFLKPGAIVCDVARPRDVSKRVSDSRDDVLVIEGGVVGVPGEVDFGLDFGVPPGTCMACMAETMVLAMEERYENFTTGRDLTVEQVDEINRLAKKHGFKLAAFRAFESALTEKDLKDIKRKASKRRKQQF